MSPVDAYLPAGLTLASLLAYAVGLITFASVMTAWRALLEGRPAAARIRAVTRRRLELQGEATRAERRRSRGQLPPGLLPLLMRRLRRMQSGQLDRIRGKLLTAGFRSREAIGIYVGAKLAGPFLLAAVAFLLVYGAQVGHLPMAWRPAVPLAAVLLGFLAPDLYLRNAAAKRRHALQKALPDGARPAGHLRRGGPQPRRGVEPGRGGGRDLGTGARRRAGAHRRGAQFPARTAARTRQSRQAGRPARGHAAWSTR